MYTRLRLVSSTKHLVRPNYSRSLFSLHNENAHRLMCTKKSKAVPQNKKSASPQSKKSKAPLTKKQLSRMADETSLEDIESQMSPEEREMVKLLEAAESEEEANKILKSFKLSDIDFDQSDEDMLRDISPPSKKSKPQKRSKSVPDAEIVEPVEEEAIEEEEEQQLEEELLEEELEGIDEELDLENVKDFSDFAKTVPKFEDPSKHLSPLKKFGEKGLYLYDKFLSLYVDETAGAELTNAESLVLQRLESGLPIYDEMLPKIDEDERVTREDKRGLRIRHQKGVVVLPVELRERIRTVLEGYSRKQLRTEAMKLSDLLRARTTTLKRQKATKVLVPGSVPVQVDEKPKKMNQVDETITVPPPMYNDTQALAYVVHRVPAVYACTNRVFNEIVDTMPEFSPKNMLDFGSGPGTAIWSAKQIWESIGEILSVEPSQGMTKVSEQILKDLPVQRRRYLFSTRATSAYDLVTASYVFSELKNNDERAATLRNLWRCTAPGGLLVIVEPGTPIGFSIIKEARKSLLDIHNIEAMIDSQDALPEIDETEEELVEEEEVEKTMKPPIINNKPRAQIVAPCPHALECPMAGSMWCHFPQRVERIPLTRSAKPHINVNYEDEKFSYIVVRKVNPGEPLVFNNPQDKKSRIMSPPLKRTGHVIVDVCSVSGDIERHIASKSDGKDVYTSTRKSVWGDMLLMSEFPPRTFKKRTNYSKLEEEKRKKKQPPPIPEDVLDAEADRIYEDILGKKTTKKKEEKEEEEEEQEGETYTKQTQTQTLEELRGLIENLRKKRVPDAEIEKRLGKENFRRIMNLETPRQPVERIEDLLSARPRFKQKSGVDVREKIVPKKEEKPKTVNSGARKRIKAKDVDDLD